MAKLEELEQQYADAGGSRRLCNCCDQTPRDVWEFDNIPAVLRVQVSNIVDGALGTTDNSKSLYEFIAKEIAHEHGRAKLAGSGYTGEEAVHLCLRHENNIVVWLDCVELSFRVIERILGEYDQHKRNLERISISAADAVTELNERFKRAGFGYRYESEKIFRIDTELTHQEITKPALHLLSDERFKGANEEFLAAHAHFKAGEYKDCAVDALNSLEITMKIICEIKGWAYPDGARASDLGKVLRREGLFPESFEQLVATLKSGLPVLRNKTGAHGQGGRLWKFLPTSPRMR